VETDRRITFDEMQRRFNTEGRILRNEFTAIIEQDGDWLIAYCPEIPGANGQGRTKEEAKKSLTEAIELILEDRREEGIRGVPEDAIKEVVSLG
jgi:predicted RNase H-like HicB family nuclease